MARYGSRCWSVLALFSILVLGGCTAVGGASGRVGSPTPTASNESVPDPNDVPPDTTDYSTDAGDEPKEYEYEDEPPPAESVVATLCNLNQAYFTGLRSVKSGTAIVDDKLRTSLVGLSDLLDYWDSLRSEYPSSAADIETGIAIYEQWDKALLSKENGDEGAAEKAMASAEELIAKLPTEQAANCTP